MTLQDATKQQVEKSVKMHRRNEELREPWNHFFEVAVDYDDDADMMIQQELAPLLFLM